MAAFKENDRNKWYASFYYKDWTGKRSKKFKRGFNTEKEALDYEKEFLEKIKRKPDMRFGQLVDIYLEDMRNRVRESTYINKSHIINDKVIPYFENMNMNDITAADVRRWQQDMMNRGYADTYLRTIHAQLSAIFNYAVRYYDLPRNPCVQAGSMGKGFASEMEIWTVDEFNQFMDVMNEKPMAGMAFTLMFWTGMRVGEMLALTSEDVDLENKTVRIVKSLQHIKGRDIITEPKTPKSRRIVLIPDELATELQRYITNIPNMTPQSRIIPLTKNYLDREIHKGAKKAGVKDIHVHCLRHSHTALIASLGASPVEAAERLGHENVQTTMNIYNHVLPGRHQAIADELGKLYKKKEDPGKQ